MALTLSRSATLYSLNQMDSDDGLLASKGVLSTPEKEVGELQGSLLPLYRFGAADGFASMRIRSFGDLSTGLPADLDADM